MPDFFAYLLRCADGSYYAGHTDDIDARLGQHQAGSLGGYTATRRPVALVWSARFQCREDAFAFERRLKNWSRAKKEALIAGDWAAIGVAAMPPSERAARLAARTAP
ncbi:excinuclease ABC subunit C [alpha proteobacterium AAP81b]|nr:excinuclease ABC subunit C [alpha proteobacterium AAP81b]